MAWTVEPLDEIVDAELDALPRYARLLPLHRAIERGGPIWEMRLKGKAGVSRGLYVTAKAQRVVVVRVFVKKTRKTPSREIELALKRAKEIL